MLWVANLFPGQSKLSLPRNLCYFVTLARPFQLVLRVLELWWFVDDHNRSFHPNQLIWMLKQSLCLHFLAWGFLGLWNCWPYGSRPLVTVVVEYALFNRPPLPAPTSCLLVASLSSDPGILILFSILSQRVLLPLSTTSHCNWGSLLQKHADRLVHYPVF